MVGQAGAVTAQSGSTLTNTGPPTTTVHLSTRALTQKIYDTGPREFTIDPAKPTDNTGTFPIWSGVTEVYQTESFTVPAASGSRLIFSADYPNTRQTSLLHFALFEPDGTYAAYSDPQGSGRLRRSRGGRPAGGPLDGAVLHRAERRHQGRQRAPRARCNGTPAPGVMSRRRPSAPRRCRSARAARPRPRSPSPTPGRPATRDESVVVSSPAGQTTVPVTIRTMVPIGAQGGVFQGVLTGGNGRDGSDAQTNTYFFDVPAGKTDLDASVALRTDPGEVLVGYLMDPDGQTVGYSSNYTEVPKSTSHLVPGSTRYLQTFAVAPQAGEWELVLDWENPVTGQRAHRALLRRHPLRPGPGFLASCPTPLRPCC